MVERSGLPEPDPSTARELPPEPERSPAEIANAERSTAYPASSSAGSDPGDRPIGTSVAVPRAKRRGSFAKELLVLLVIAVVLAVLIKTFLVQAFFIPSVSMQQTLQVHDRVLVNKLERSPTRGEIVVFDISGTGFAKSASPSEYVPCPRSDVAVRAVRSAERFVGVATCGQDDYIKRVIAVPGDTVEGVGGHVLVNGKQISEPYVYQDDGAAFCEASLEEVERSPGSFEPSRCATDPKPITVPAGMYWVMGDHRSASSDSRYNGFVPKDKIVGRAFVRILPLGRFGLLRVPHPAAGGTAAAASLGALPMLVARRRRRR